MAKYIEKCDQYQRNKNWIDALAKKLMPNSTPTKPQNHISTNFITKLSLAQEFDSILVVCNCFTKMAHFIATTEKTSAEGLARLFRDYVWKLHSLPESIVSDRGPQFAAEVMKKLNELLKIEMKLSITYHPQMDNQTKRINQELEQYLRMFIDHKQEQWLEQLKTAEFAYNNKIHSATKVFSFKVNSEQDPQMGFEERKNGKHEAVGKFAERIKKIQEKARAALTRAQEEIKQYTDRQRSEGKEYKVGDWVMLSTKDLRWQIKKRQTEKLIEQFIGPYKVKKIISTNALELKLLSTIKIYLVVNISKVQLYKQQIEGQKKTLGELVIVDREEEYKVEKILNK